MIMKTRYFIALVAFVAMSLSTMLAQTGTPTLHGVWQMSFLTSSSPDEPGELKTGNSLKILTTDGKFMNVVMMPQGAIIIGYGTYKINSDESYTEVVEKNIHLPQLNGQENQLMYEFSEDGNVMYLKFFVKYDINGNQIDSWSKEIWKRVIMPDEYPTNIVR